MKTHKCQFCGEDDPAKMMKNGRSRTFNRCKKCHNLRTIERGRKNREEYIAYKGGACERCGYNRCCAALDFHHRDPSKKDPSFESIRYWGMERAKEELDRCMLVCSNCHRELHEELRS